MQGRNLTCNIANISTTKLVEEGIDFDLANLTVSYNPNHEENVDSSEKHRKLRKSSNVLHFFLLHPVTTF